MQGFSSLKPHWFIGFFHYFFTNNKFKWKCNTELSFKTSFWKTGFFLLNPENCNFECNWSTLNKLIIMTIDSCHVLSFLSCSNSCHLHANHSFSHCLLTLMLSHFSAIKTFKLIYLNNKSTFSGKFEKYTIPRSKLNRS